MDKYIFKWTHTDGYTYFNDVIYPFECDDVDKFLYNIIQNVQKDGYTSIFNELVYIYEHDLENLEHCVIPLNDWFENEKYKI